MPSFCDFTASLTAVDTIMVVVQAELSTCIVRTPKGAKRIPNFIYF